MQLIATEKNEFKGSVYMVFDFMEHDLAGLLKRGTEFALPHVKCLAQQLLTGMHYLHGHDLLHRDLKSMSFCGAVISFLLSNLTSRLCFLIAANILLAKNGVLKIGDFGLVREFDPDRAGRFTKVVCTVSGVG